MRALQLLFLYIRRHPWRAFGLAALASLPAALVSQWRDWDMMDPQSYVLEAAWTPVLLWCQLAVLRDLGRLAHPLAGMPEIRGRTLASAFGAEVLLGCKFAVVALLWALPALAALAALGLERPWARVIIVGWALAGSVPATLWLLRRLLASPVILWQGLNASQALEESARLCEGRLNLVVWQLLFMNGLGLLADSLSSDSMLLGVLVLPLSFLVSQAVAAWAYRNLTL